MIHTFRLLRLLLSVILVVTAGRSTINHADGIRTALLIDILGVEAIPTTRQTMPEHIALLPVSG